MQQKGRTEQILDKLQDMIVNGQASLAPGKVSVPRDEMLRIVQELSDTMKVELRQYRDITDKRAKILREAQKEADDIIYEAEQTASRIRVSGRKTRVAPVRMLDLTETERRSLDNANEIYAASLIYTDEMMAEMEQVVHTAYERIHASYVYALQDLRVKSEMIAANRRELMEDLRSLEKEDRYQQILEIGQLLSQELYHARKREMEEANDQNVQLELDFGNQKEQPEAVVAEAKIYQSEEVTKTESNQQETDVSETESKQPEVDVSEAESKQPEVNVSETENNQQEANVAETEGNQQEANEEESESSQQEAAVENHQSELEDSQPKEDDGQQVAMIDEEERRHRQFVEAHEEIVRQVEERWLNTVYDAEIPVIKFDNLE